MFKDITIGQYIPGSSPLHKMYPALKIILTIAYIVVLFFLHKPLSYAAFFVFTAALILISGVSVKIILKGIRPMLWILIFTALINLFMTQGETVFSIPLWAFSINISREGIVLAATMTIRLLFLIVGASAEGAVVRNSHDDDDCDTLYTDARGGNGQNHQGADGARRGF